MKKFAAIIALILGFAASAFAAPGVNDLEIFKSIPVMDSGRLKPLDTYARSLLTQFSGKDHDEKESGSAWLAKLLFDPQATLNDRVFLINDPDIAVALGISVDAHRRYAPNQLIGVYRKLGRLAQQAQAIPEKERSLIENEIIRVFDNINLYADLSRTFAFVLKPEDAIALANIKQLPFTVIPLADGQWTSPWDLVRFNLVDEQRKPLLEALKTMAVSYAKADAVSFEVAAHGYLNAVPDLLSKDDAARFGRFGLERFYHASSPFTWGIMFYIIAFLCFLVSLASTARGWYVLGVLSVAAGFIPHTLGFIARVIIMARPPVSSLYETFIFVGFTTVLLGILIELKDRQWLGLVTAAISGSVMLFIANKYSTEGDTLKMLIAVLNSNFWLATHVTTITMGYGATCVAGLLGHVWLIQAIAGKPKAVLEKTYKTTLGILGVALTLTFLGTNLGGIWADQSWGRFWGWDPKENGALMIVLWCAILLHAKVANLINALGTAVGSVVGMIIVMWAWFGVNLLSVGLHSYGFTQGVATGLIIYVIFELLFIALMVLLINKNVANMK